MAAFGLFETLDLTRVTDRLVDEVKSAFDASPLWDVNGGTLQKFQISINGSMPESVRNVANCQMNLYLVQVSRNPFQSNAPLPEPPRQIPELRLSLDLYYLLTAHNKANYRDEQRAMSIALRCLHEHPRFSTTVTVGGQSVEERIHITMETESADELGRLWQSFGTPARLSAIYKVSVVYITPQPAAPLPKPVERVVVATGVLPENGTIQVLGTLRSIRFHEPSSTTAAPEQVEYDQSPATVAAGDRFWLFGVGLDQPQAARVFLQPPGGAEQGITSWRQTPGSTDQRLLLRVPTSGAPPPGIYGIRVGDASTRSNVTPVSVAAAIDPPTAPPPILTATAGVFTVTGSGFAAGATELLVGGRPLAEVGGAPAAGQFRVSSAADALDFRAPAGLPTGQYTVRIRVNGVESIPAWWVQT
jgi:hypothetical protein